MNEWAYIKILRRMAFEEFIDFSENFEHAKIGEIFFDSKQFVDAFQNQPE